MTTYNAHVDAFHRAPLSAKPDLCRARIAELQAELDSGNSRGPDEYYWLKDRIREYSAALAGKTAAQYDPMGYWHGMMSN